MSVPISGETQDITSLAQHAAVNASQNYGPLDLAFFGERGRGRPGMAGDLAAGMDSTLMLLGAAAVVVVVLVLLKRVS